jgi:membrane protease YdiL (CAAX protease family)
MALAGVTVAGASLLRASLSARPGSAQFNARTLGVAATWLIGGLRSGPRDLGCAQAGTSRTRVLRPVATGVGAFGAFFGAALIARRIPVLNDAITSLMQHAHHGPDRLVLASTLANAVGEEVFFRGAVFAALESGHPVTASTAVYTLAASVTGNPALVVASATMGALFARQRRASGGIEAPLLTHLTWSTLMLRYLPRLFGDGAA